MPHTRHRTWIEIQKKQAGFNHPTLGSSLDHEWIPNADVIEHPDGLTVRLEVAGIDHSSLQIVVATTALVISGRRLNPDTGGTAAGIRFSQMEIEYGPFERVLPLPVAVSQHDARARYVDGILEISMVRPAGPQKKRKMVIDIQW